METLQVTRSNAPSDFRPFGRARRVEYALRNKSGKGFFYPMSRGPNR